MLNWLKQTLRLTQEPEQPTFDRAFTPRGVSSTVYNMPNSEQSDQQKTLPISPWHTLDITWEEAISVIDCQVKAADERADARTRKGNIHGHSNPGRDMSLGVHRLIQEIEAYKYIANATPGDNAHSLLEEVRKLGEGLKRSDDDGFVSDTILFTLNEIKNEIESS